LSILLDERRVALALPVKIEILSGAGAAKFRKLQSALSALPTYSPATEEWAQIESWIEKFPNHGFGFADLLIASIASLRSKALWTLDKDFQRMAKRGFITLYRF